MVFQSYAVWPHMNVFDNVAYPLKIQKIPRNEINKKVSETLEAVHLSEYANRMPNELSGGQQQRVALGRALVSNPRVLLLDEPLSNLDAKLRESMRFEIKEMQKNFGITVVYVTHDQTEAMAMSDKVIVFNKGVVQQIEYSKNIPTGRVPVPYILREIAIGAPKSKLDIERVAYRNGEGLYFYCTIFVCTRKAVILP